MEGYKRIDPSYPERILQMAEKHAEADVFMENAIGSVFFRP
jgi:hypothetical protein